MDIWEQGLLDVISGCYLARWVFALYDIFDLFRIPIVDGVMKLQNTSLALFSRQLQGAMGLPLMIGNAVLDSPALSN